MGLKLACMTGCVDYTQFTWAFVGSYTGLAQLNSPVFVLFLLKCFSSDVLELMRKSPSDCADM